MRNESRDAPEVRGQQWLLRLAMGDGEAPCDAEPVGWQVGMGSGDTTQCYTQPRDHPGRSKVLPVGLGLLDGGGRRLDADVAAAQLRLEISSFVFFFFLIAFSLFHHLSFLQSTSLSTLAVPCPCLYTCICQACSLQGSIQDRSSKNELTGTSDTSF